MPEVFGTSNLANTILTQNDQQRQRRNERQRKKEEERNFILDVAGTGVNAVLGGVKANQAGRGLDIASAAQAQRAVESNQRFGDEGIERQGLADQRDRTELQFGPLGTERARIDAIGGQRRGDALRDFLVQGASGEVIALNANPAISDAQKQAAFNQIRAKLQQDISGLQSQGQGQDPFGPGAQSPAPAARPFVSQLDPSLGLDQFDDLDAGAPADNPLAEAQLAQRLSSQFSENPEAFGLPLKSAEAAGRFDPSVFVNLDRKGKLALINQAALTGDEALVRLAIEKALGPSGGIEQLRRETVRNAIHGEGLGRIAKLFSSPRNLIDVDIEEDINDPTLQLIEALIAEEDIDIDVGSVGRDIRRRGQFLPFFRDEPESLFTRP